MVLCKHPPKARRGQFDLERPAVFRDRRFGKSGEFIGDRFDVDDDWIEVFWYPFLAFAMALGSRIVDGFEGFGIVRRPANIFGRASSAASSKPG